MEWSVVLILVLQTLVIGGLGAFFFTSRAPRDETAPLRDMVAAVEARQEQLETRWQTILEELNERVESANKAYARARASQAAYRRRKERDEELEEEEDEQHDLNLPPGNGGGSDTRGMFTVPSPMAEAVEPPWRQAARSYAALIARGGAG